MPACSYTIFIAGIATAYWLAGCRWPSASISDNSATGHEMISPFVTRSHTRFAPLINILAMCRIVPEEARAVPFCAALHIRSANLFALSSTT